MLRAQGATVVDPVAIPRANDDDKAGMTVLLYQFTHDINAYLATRTGLTVHSLAALIAFDDAHAAEEMPRFGQKLFLEAEAEGSLTDKAHRDALAKLRRLAGRCPQTEYIRRGCGLVAACVAVAFADRYRNAVFRHARGIALNLALSLVSIALTACPISPTPRT